MMCGVAGAFARDNERALHRETLLAMLATQVLRGPDASGIYLGRSAALGSVRLAIQDVDGGNQPFISNSGKVVCCYNGEIYNFETLRQDLSRRGCRFTTRCDGEVIANLYALDGIDGLKQLDGQYGIALWDSVSATGVLARDEFGIVPLFFAPVANRVVFASTLRAFLADPTVPGTLNTGTLLDCCAFWTPIGRHSILDGVHAVLPGEILTIRQGTVTSRHRRFQLPSLDADAEPPPSSEEIRHLLAAAVRRRLPTEVPYGTYLSGGVDSAAVCGFIAREHAAPTALSVTFPDSPRDESPQQRETALALGLRHLTIECRPNDIAAHFQAAVLHAEAPIVRTSPVATYLLSRLAHANGIKVILTGEGSDEVFSGYDIHRSIPLVEQLATGTPVAALLTPDQQADWTTRDPFVRASHADEAPILAGEAIAAQVAAQAAALLSNPFGVYILRWQNQSRLADLMAPALRAQFALSVRCRSLSNVLPADFIQLDPLRKAALIDFNTLLVGFLLSSQGDRMAMANSTELRLPFLDRALVRRVWQIPWTERMPRQTNKMVLRQALEGLLPDAIRLRPKKAFAATDLALREERIWSGLEPYLSPETARRFGFFDPIAVDRMIRDARQTGAHGNDFTSPFSFIASTHILAEHIRDSNMVGPKRGGLALQLSRFYIDGADGILETSAR